MGRDYQGLYIQRLNLRRLTCLIMVNCLAPLNKKEIKPIEPFIVIARLESCQLTLAFNMPSDHIQAYGKK